MYVDSGGVRVPVHLTKRRGVQRQRSGLQFKQETVVLYNPGLLHLGASHLYTGVCREEGDVEAHNDERPVFFRRRTRVQRQSEFSSTVVEG